MLPISSRGFGGIVGPTVNGHEDFFNVFLHQGRGQHSLQGASRSFDGIQEAPTRMNQESKSDVGADTVFVIPVGPRCRPDFVADTIESVRFFAPRARIIVVDDTGREQSIELAEHSHVSVVKATRTWSLRKSVCKSFGRIQ